MTALRKHDGRSAFRPLPRTWSDRDVFGEPTFGKDRFFCRLKVQLYRFTNVPAGLVERLSFGEASGQSRYVNRVTTFLGWFEYDFEDHEEPLCEKSTYTLSVIDPRL